MARSDRPQGSWSAPIEPACWFTLLCERAHSFELKGATTDRWICLVAQGSLAKTGTGTLTLSGSTFLYVLLWQMEAAFWLWAIVSILLGLGFTFFSGAVEAWLVDALAATGFTGQLEQVFGRGQIVTGVGMLAGSVAGGVSEPWVSSSAGSPQAPRSSSSAVPSPAAAVVKVLLVPNIR